ncbi:hypothetical protein MLP_30010 [Microlunatus phosphovorus NM-1]|uniref:Uncharacterized protein n=1 Tax=Microlunatus phosphovorus (strain ATCC 700054 / DSM 10555 / JCM 9379 / NBRC 101784 / NCIMB 13414 / VKM Ac-1990 / NM-1) TaxID=1032480 RepID=F5XKE3_MICPN|nr:hypothetical protein [Microlunatus phosphovorus]BAK36015.1 hypothetical protein MLP_30010 [Microlunatus phosphovorus NM-1]
MSDVILVVSTVVGQLFALIPLQPTSSSHNGGFPLSVLAAFWALGLLAVVAKFATSKPRNRRRPPHR